jgi:acetylornithine deacetylase/succinyl-diaminopimelate desuccinylase-like protein
VSLRSDVEALAAIVRDSAGPGERAAAALVAERLRAAGTQDVRVRPFRAQGTYAWAHALHAAAGLAGGPVALAALASLELEASGRVQWLRRALPTTEGANVVARVPAAGPRRATLVLAAHHDAARTGVAWHPALARAARGRRLRRRAMDPFLAPTAAGFALAALPWRAPRRAGRTLLLLSVLAEADIARSSTVPGASDNATGVAALLALAGRFAAAPLPGVEVVLASMGCEEAGMGGMAAFLRDHPLDPATSFVLGLDTLGAGRPILARAEGALLAHRYRPGDLALVDAGARRAGRPPPERWRLGGWTDPILARFAGLPAACLLSVGPDGGFSHYHLPSDTPDRVDWASVEACAEIAAGVAAVLSDVYVS